MNLITLKVYNFLFHQLKSFQSQSYTFEKNFQQYIKLLNWSSSDAFVRQLIDHISFSQFDF
jgi:hypothetical protein